VRELRIALVGCGDHARENLLPALLQLSGARLVALCDNADSSLAAAAHLAPEALRSKNYEKIIDPMFVDALIVAGPPQLHAACAARAIELGIHVLVEKPPSIDSDTLRTLAEAASARGLVAGVAHNLRHANAINYVTQILQGCDFGTITALSLTYSASGPLGPRWGIKDTFRAFLLSHAVHAFDMVAHLGGPIDSFAASRRSDQRLSCQLSCSLSFRSGGVGAILVGTGAANFQLNLFAAGSCGMSLHMDGLNSVLVWGGYGFGSREARLWKPRTLETGYRNAGYLNELEAFVQAVRGVGVYSPSFEDEINTYDWIERLYG
jgi:phthalate 4,5-cis-dihydrodiol dehydrogenase